MECWCILRNKIKNDKIKKSNYLTNVSLYNQFIDNSDIMSV